MVISNKAKPTKIKNSVSKNIVNRKIDNRLKIMHASFIYAKITRIHLVHLSNITHYVISLPKLFHCIHIRLI